ncbi:MAG: diguanylate cyclase [Candidatus Neptunochlamydia sp.]|nr:diguanylate cyclase [Candidatus Neptunochlamydia sp.]
MVLKPKKLPTLLLVTSLPLVRAFFEKIIDRIEGYFLIITSSRLETLEYLDKTHISFIVIDEKTANIALHPLCEEIRRFKGHDHTPILIITSHLKKSFTRDLIKAGATDFLREPLDEDEFFARMEMAGDVMQTQSKISALTTYLSKQQKGPSSLEKRTILDDQATRLVHEALAEKTALALIFLEIDQYDQVLKARGENAAHALTLDYGDHLRKLMRSEDLLYNQSQGKFAIFLPKTSCKASEFIAENIMEYLDAEIFSTGNIRFTLTASIGIATLEQTGDMTKNDTINLERLMKGASSSLNKAKEKTNTVVSYKKHSGESS